MDSQKGLVVLSLLAIDYHSKLSNTLLLGYKPDFSLLLSRANHFLRLKDLLLEAINDPPRILFDHLVQPFRDDDHK